MISGTCGPHLVLPGPLPISSETNIFHPHSDNSAGSDRGTAALDRGGSSGRSWGGFGSSGDFKYGTGFYLIGGKMPQNAMKRLCILATSCRRSQSRSGVTCYHSETIFWDCLVKPSWIWSFFYHQEIFRA